jgi:hypothetical protein
MLSWWIRMMDSEKIVESEKTFRQTTLFEFFYPKKIEIAFSDFTFSESTIGAMGLSAPLGMSLTGNMEAYMNFSTLACDYNTVEMEEESEEVILDTYMYLAIFRSYLRATQKIIKKYTPKQEIITEIERENEIIIESKEETQTSILIVIIILNYSEIEKSWNLMKQKLKLKEKIWIKKWAKLRHCENPNQKSKIEKKLHQIPYSCIEFPIIKK